MPLYFTINSVSYLQPSIGGTYFTYFVLTPIKDNLSRPQQINKYASWPSRISLSRIYKPFGKSLAQPWFNVGQSIIALYT